MSPAYMTEDSKHYESRTTMAIPCFFRCSDRNLTYHLFSSRNATAGHAMNHLSRSGNECLALEAEENQSRWMGRR
jgi:hypothetical protein